MTEGDTRRTLKLLSLAYRIANEDAQDIFGELSQAQVWKLTGLLIGFVAAHLDADHPREDGRKWKDVFKACLAEKMKGEE